MTEEKIVKLIEEVEKAEDKVREALEEAWPSGSTIETMHGWKGTCSGHTGKGYVIVGYEKDGRWYQSAIRRELIVTPMASREKRKENENGGRSIPSAY
jgi:hypothetical protein